MFCADLVTAGLLYIQIHLNIRLLEGKELGWMTGFEFHPTPWTINKIQHFRVQMAAKSSRLCANLQPIATKILTSKNG
jgi:hypothetical protein